MPITEDLPGQEPSPEEVAQDRLDAVLPAIEAVVAERFGGLWIERWQPATIAVAVVRPTQQDVDRIGELARSVGWSAHVCAVRYSQAELDRFVDRLGDLMASLRSEQWASTGPSPETNRVEVWLSGADPDLIRTIAASIPKDALSIRIAPGIRFEALKETSALDRPGG